MSFQDNDDTFTITRNCLDKHGKESISVDPAYDKVAQDNAVLCKVHLEVERCRELVRFPDSELCNSIKAGLDEFFSKRYQKPLCIGHLEENLFKATFKRVKGKDLVAPLIHESKNWQIFVKVRETSSSSYFTVPFEMKRALASICKYTTAKCKWYNPLSFNCKHDKIHKSEIQFCVQVLKVADDKKRRYTYLEEECRKVAGKMRRSIQNNWPDVEKWEQQKQTLNFERRGLIKGEDRAEEKLSKVFLRKRASKFGCAISKSQQQKAQPWRRPPLVGRPLQETRRPRVNVSAWENRTRTHAHSDSGSPLRYSSCSPSQETENWCPSSSSPVRQNYCPSLSSEDSYRLSSPSPLPYSGLEVEPIHDPTPSTSIGDWLRSIGEAFIPYIKEFERNGVEIEDLATCADRGELEDLGVTHKFHQTKLMKMAKKHLSSSQNVGSPPVVKASAPRAPSASQVVKAHERRACSISLTNVTKCSTLAENWLKKRSKEAFRKNKNRTWDTARALLEAREISDQEYEALKTLCQNGERLYDLNTGRMVGDLGNQRDRINRALTTLGLTCSSSF